MKISPEIPLDVCRRLLDVIVLVHGDNTPASQGMEMAAQMWQILINYKKPI